jgi:hypothetical protein
MKDKTERGSSGQPVIPSSKARPISQTEPSPFSELTFSAIATSTTKMIELAHFSLRVVSITFPGAAPPKPRCELMKAKVSGSLAASTTVVATSNYCSSRLAQ